MSILSKYLENESSKQKDLTSNFFGDGFFYFFGFIDNPAEDKVNSILSTSVNDQIKSDLKRINKAYKKQYNLIRKGAF